MDAAFGGTVVIVPFIMFEQKRDRFFRCSTLNWQQVQSDPNVLQRNTLGSRFVQLAVALPDDIPTDHNASLLSFKKIQGITLKSIMQRLCIRVPSAASPCRKTVVSNRDVTEGNPLLFRLLEAVVGVVEDVVFEVCGHEIEEDGVQNLLCRIL